MSGEAQRKQPGKVDLTWTICGVNVDLMWSLNYNLVEKVEDGKSRIGVSVRNTERITNIRIKSNFVDRWRFFNNQHNPAIYPNTPSFS